MILKNLELKNFRLHKSSKINFSENLNYIVGGNGQGKTSVLEAIYFLSTTKGFGQTNDKETISFGENFFEIKGNFISKTNNNVRIFFASTDKRKKYFLNGKQIFKHSEIIGKFPVVILSLSDHEITMGSPALRRKFVDSIISQSSGTYLKILLEYNKTLKHRASLLQSIREGKIGKSSEQLDVWTETLAKLGSEIILHRKSFVSEFESYVISSYKNIMNEKEIPKISYITFAKEFDENDIYEKLLSAFREKKDLEIARAANLIGPHRDDFDFYLNNKPLKKFGSQGQHKTFQIALRFAQFYYIKDKSGETPLFLMDDIFGELDVFRSGKIRDYLNKIGQAFITMTDFTRFESFQKNSSDNFIFIENGKIANA